MKSKLLCLVIPALIALFSMLAVGCGGTDQTNNNTADITSSPDSNAGWRAPDTLFLPKNDSGNLIRYGRALVANTGAYFGPKGKIGKHANGMHCQNCHLDAGTRLYANTFSAVYSCYPKFRARSGALEHLEKRINDCMERSMNGKKLDSLSKEMRAMIAYINWVGKDVEKNVRPHGVSVVALPYMDRPADTTKGRIAFLKNCVTCHGVDGQGRLETNGVTFLYPPLWGPHSYNTAAGMIRLSLLSGFIKSNMPNLQSSYNNPVLTDEEAWDIAAFINSMPRPVKRFKQDWPDISMKPFDFPFGPYADTFTEVQHKYGPFEEILQSSKK